MAQEPVETTIVTVVCPRCKDEAKITVSSDGYALWKTGRWLLQDALPELSDDQRERILTGTCTPCWDEMWKEG